MAHRHQMDGFSRRKFVSFLAGSPLFAAAGVDFRSLDRLFQGAARDRGAALDQVNQVVQQAVQQPTLITAAREALDVFDFEPVAQSKVPPAHWGYLATG